MTKKKRGGGRAPRRTKEERLFDNISLTAQQFMRGKSYRPMSEKELFERLKLPPDYAPLLSAVLQTLVEKKSAVFKGGRFSSFRSPSEVVTGVIKVHPRGFGFLQPEIGSEIIEEVFVPKHLTMNAVDGDRVEVLINTEAFSDKGPEGRVIAILDRSRSHVAGTIFRIERNGTILAYVPLLGRSSRVVVEKRGDEPLAVGDRAVFEVLEWGGKDKETSVRLSSVIGNIEDPSCDVPAAVEEFSLHDRFPVAVVTEAKEFGQVVTESEMRGRLDLRDERCFTIDPDTARDYDDAVSVSKEANGNFVLHVHIADVTHYMRPGSALDKEAKLRSNSVYFPGAVLPMLPEELSNELCSLKADVERLAVSVLMRLNPSGELIDYQFAKSVIRSKKRLTYREAKRILDGELESPFKKDLELMTELCKELKKQRYKRGSIEFSLAELVIKVDKEGVPTGTDYIEYDVTHQMIEEFMLKANEVVAEHLFNQGKAITYRVHDEPAEENMREFAKVARSFGFNTPDLPTVSDLQRLFDEVGEAAVGPFLATSFIRRMRLAAYSAENIGHFGLALTHYCHFTSPIRRYADVVVHRALFDSESGEIDIEGVATHCSNQERIAAKAEMSVILLKKLRYLKQLLKEDGLRSFPAVVTKVKPFGFFFEVIDLMIEGFLHVSEIDQDFFVFDEGAMRLQGRSTGKVYEAGVKLEVMASSVDLICQEVRWYLVSEKEKKKR